jgi:hypothetical protein
MTISASLVYRAVNGDDTAHNQLVAFISENIANGFNFDDLVVEAADCEASQVPTDYQLDCYQQRLIKDVAHHFIEHKLVIK